MGLSKFMSKKTKKILVVDDGRTHHLIKSGEKQYLDGEEVVMREDPVFADEPETRKSPKQTMRERLYKHITMGKCRVNAPKRHTCPKCQFQARRIRKAESTKSMPALGFYKCRCGNSFEIKLGRQ